MCGILLKQYSGDNHDTNIYMRKEGSLPINYPNFHLKKLEKRRANEIQRKQKNKNNKDQDGRQENRNRKHNREKNEIKSGSVRKSIILMKLARLIRGRKSKKTQIVNIRDEPKSKSMKEPKF